MKKTFKIIKNKWNEVLALLGPDKKFNILYILFYTFIMISGMVGVLSPLFGLESIQVILMAAPVGVAISMSYNTLENKFKQLKEER